MHASVKIGDSFIMLNDEFPDWGRVRADLEAALDGRLALDERLAERERHYARRRRLAAAVAPPVSVTTHDDASSYATVVEVRAPDTGPVLYRIARAISEAGLFITWARVSTLGSEVVDVFYVQTVDGGKLPGGPDRHDDLERAVAAALEAPAD